MVGGTDAEEEGLGDSAGGTGVSATEGEALGGGGTGGAVLEREAFGPASEGVAAGETAADEGSCSVGLGIFSAGDGGRS